MENKRLIFVSGSIGLVSVGVGLIGLFYVKKRREKEMGIVTEHMEIKKLVSGPEAARINAAITALSNREKRELAERIKAMSPEEWEVIVDVIPVNLCLERINREIEKAAEIQASITRAYEMVKQ